MRGAGGVLAGCIHPFVEAPPRLQAALVRVRLPIAITHAPGHMLVTDLRDSQLAGAAPELPELPGSVLRRSGVSAAGV